VPQSPRVSDRPCASRCNEPTSSPATIAATHLRHTRRSCSASWSVRVPADVSSSVMESVCCTRLFNVRAKRPISHVEMHDESEGTCSAKRLDRLRSLGAGWPTRRHNRGDGESEPLRGRRSGSCDR
jgi:hypothetical protein